MVVVNKRTTNRYLKRIFYGNRTTLLDNAGQRPRFLTDEQLANFKKAFGVCLEAKEYMVKY